MAAPAWARHARLLAPAWVAAVLVHYRGLGTYFTPDDVVSLRRAAGLDPAPLDFRPLSSVLAFRIQHALFGLDPLGYHAVDLIAHLANTGLVYALALRLMGGPRRAASAAVVFAASGIAFTPLHWMSGVGDLLACGLLIAATLLHLESRARGRESLAWAGAALAATAVLAKEVAIGWPLVVAALERWGPPAPGRDARGRRRALLPAITMGIASFLWLGATRGAPPSLPSAPYAVSTDVVHLVANLFTYLRWCVALDPIPDRMATVQPSAWPVGLAVLLTLLAGAWTERARPERPVTFGLTWLVAFLAPALPLVNHSYLYYLYVPWVGGAVAITAVVARAPALMRRRELPAVSLAAFVALQAWNVERREQATQDALPIDPTMRDASLLAHAVPDLRAAHLPQGARVGFVNPVPRARFDVVRGAPTTAAAATTSLPHYPLETAMLGGKTLELLVPGVAYAGFADTIPSGWDDVDCFLFEQRGYLRYWGHGQAARDRQADYLATLRR
jgi:hypothetical protein